MDGSASESVFETDSDLAKGLVFGTVCGFAIVLTNGVVSLLGLVLFSSLILSVPLVLLSSLAFSVLSYLHLFSRTSPVVVVLAWGLAFKDWGYHCDGVTVWFCSCICICS